MNIKAYAISIITLLSLVGCSADPYDNIAEEYAKYNLGSGDVAETSVNNDLYEYAQVAEFENNSLSITGSLNSTTDNYDYFKFTTLVGGTYDVVLTGNDSYDIDVELYNDQREDIGNFSNNNDSSDTWSFIASTNYIYVIKMRGYSTGGANANYLISISKR